jgi:superfamily II DNA or RNA helicase
MKNPNSGIRDNRHFGKVGDFLQQKIQPASQLRFVSAYFSLFGFEVLRDELESIEKLHFLFGEPAFIKPLDVVQTEAKNFAIVDNDLSLLNRLKQKALAKACADWIVEKVEIRSLVQTNLLHGKLYHIDNRGVEAALLGSSNFTLHGLGDGNSNIELNLIVDSDRDRQDLKCWFDEIWQDKTLVQDVKADVLNYLQQFYIEHSPYFIYLKTLFHLFETYLKERQATELLAQQIGFYETDVWQKLYDFQKVGVTSAITKINKHNGCIIADSVGLGKTFEALAVIKYFECRNSKVLVICPKNLSQNWTFYQASQNHESNPLKSDRLNYSVIFHTDVGRTSGISKANGINLANFHWENFDLVVIDESHNFRGNPLEKNRPNGDKTMNRAKWLMDKILKSGGKTKVLLLSATPVNNSLRDLSNQIAFITEGKNDALLESCRVKNLTQTLTDVQKQFAEWASSPKRKANDLFNRLDGGFFTILDELTIARSRKHIVRSYNVEAIGNFPKRNKPISIYAELDSEDELSNFESINKQILSYELAIFNPTKHLHEDKKAKYDAKVGEQRELNLTGMMKTNFLKRLESSVSSFEITLARTLKKIERLEKQISDFTVGQESNVEIESLDETDLEENGAEFVGQKLKFHLGDLRLDEWLEALKNDKAALSSLHSDAKKITPPRDAKLQELKKLIASKIQHPLNAGNQKVLIFTAFADTAQYLYENLHGEFDLNSALICGNQTQTNFGKNDYNSILTNFSPRSKGCGAIENGEIDLLIATDCISEGQNLQDCDYLVNYDIHWNPVRIIQRFGRIDRLGSTNKVIQMVNFWATAELDVYLGLKARVETRMVLVDLTATGDDNLLSEEDNEELNYRHHQLEKLKNDVLDLEDTDESISLTDFTLDDFRSELLDGLDQIRRRLEDAPLGLHALVASPSGDYVEVLKRDFSALEKEVMKTGVIFCLRQKSENESNAKINPLHPHFLVYIGENGDVHYHYTHAKQILEVFKLLCEHQEKAHDVLCHWFNSTTKNGEDVSVYSELLKKAVAELVEIVKTKGQQSLLGGRGAVLVPAKKQISSLSDFDLITWLIIK